MIRDAFLKQTSRSQCTYVCTSVLVKYFNVFSSIHFHCTRPAWVMRRVVCRFVEVARHAAQPYTKFIFNELSDFFCTQQKQVSIKTKRANFLILYIRWIVTSHKHFDFVNPVSVFIVLQQQSDTSLIAFSFFSRFGDDADILILNIVRSYDRW